jgi:thiamine pyrophosphokinase
VNGTEALLVGAAPAPDDGGFYAKLISDAQYVIAADAGVSVCLAAGRVPDVCIGDFDSADPADLERARRQGAEMHTYPARKDESDLDLAIALARSRGFRAVDITAASSGRLDHTLAALGTLLGAAPMRARFLEPDFTAFVADAVFRPELDLACTRGATVSIFAVGCDAIVSSVGLIYPLEHTTLCPLSSLGLSNVAAAPSQTIQVARGRVLVIISESNGDVRSP